MQMSYRETLNLSKDQMLINQLVNPPSHLTLIGTLVN